MSKPKMYGQKTSYIPNAKADMRRHKKVYQRGREKARMSQPEKKEPPCATCLRWPECNGVDDDCPMRRERR